MLMPIAGRRIDPLPPASSRSLAGCGANAAGVILTRRRCRRAPRAAAGWRPGHSPGRGHLRGLRHAAREAATRGAVSEVRPLGEIAGAIGDRWNGLRSGDAAA
jgi:hypothetical protein